MHASPFSATSRGFNASLSTALSSSLSALDRTQTIDSAMSQHIRNSSKSHPALEGPHRVLPPAFINAPKREDVLQQVS